MDIHSSVSSQPRADWDPPPSRPVFRPSRPMGMLVPAPRPPPSMDIEMEESKSILIDLVEEREQRIIDRDENFEPQAECCIYRVPSALRQKNEKAYTPKVIAIGPLHHPKDKFAKLADMEKQKIRYKREFFDRITPEKKQQLIMFVAKNEQSIRNSYEENSELGNLEFIGMILYDAVFIIELFLRYYRQESDFLLDRSYLRETILSDLRLLENQLPFFVLDELHKITFPNSGHENGDPSFISLSCVFFRHYKRGEKVTVKAEDIWHFTDLTRYFVTMSYTPPKECQKKGEETKDLPSAAKLQASGVRFKGIEQRSFLDIRFKKKKSQGISCCKVAELQIPKLVVDDYTERLMRNLMALEQCHYPREAFVCKYIDLMDMLIDTDEDVNLLAEAGIISSHLGEGASVANMFNDLSLEIHLLESNYDGIIKALRDHYDNPWNHLKANLKMVYFTNLWRGTATFAAIVLLLLTLIQTICSVMQVV